MVLTIFYFTTSVVFLNRITQNLELEIQTDKELIDRPVWAKHKVVEYLQTYFDAHPTLKLNRLFVATHVEFGNKNWLIANIRLSLTNRSFSSFFDNSPQIFLESESAIKKSYRSILSKREDGSKKAINFLSRKSSYYFDNLAWSILKLIIYSLIFSIVTISIFSKPTELEFNILKKLKLIRN